MKFLGKEKKDARSPLCLGGFPDALPIERLEGSLGAFRASPLPDSRGRLIIGQCPIFHTFHNTERA